MNSLPRLVGNELDTSSAGNNILTLHNYYYNDESQIEYANSIDSRISIGNVNSYVNVQNAATPPISIVGGNNFCIKSADDVTGTNQWPYPYMAKSGPYHTMYDYSRRLYPYSDSSTDITWFCIDESVWVPENLQQESLKGIVLSSLATGGSGTDWEGEVGTYDVCNKNSQGKLNRRTVRVIRNIKHQYQETSSGYTFSLAFIINDAYYKIIDMTGNLTYRYAVFRNAELFVEVRGTDVATTSGINVDYRFLNNLPYNQVLNEFRLIIPEFYLDAVCVKSCDENGFFRKTWKQINDATTTGG